MPPRSRKRKQRNSSPSSAQPTPTSIKGTCKDCGSLTRPVSKPGPRCATCRVARRKAVSEARRLTYVAKQYGLTPEQYKALLEACGGLCMICNRIKARAVDHDHAHCAGKTSCGECVRGLLCTRCNVYLGHIRDNPAVGYVLANYLKDPPAKHILKERA